MQVVHETLYTTLLLLTIGLTIWALFSLVSGGGVSGTYRATYVLTVVTAVVQAIVGLIMVANDLRPASNFHYLYGISLIVFTGAGYAFAARSDDPRREALILGIASLAAFGLIMRAVATAHG